MDRSIGADGADCKRFLLHCSNLESAAALECAPQCSASTATLRAAAAGRPSFPDAQVPAAARARGGRTARRALSEAPPASDGELALAHDAGLRRARSTEGTPVGGAAARDRLSLVAGDGRTCAPLGRRHDRGGTRRAGRRGRLRNLAGGTHHAYADKGAGYCVFNDVAVAARLMQAEWHRRAAARCCASR